MNEELMKKVSKYSIAKTFLEERNCPVDSGKITISKQTALDLIGEHNWKASEFDRLEKFDEVEYSITAEIEQDYGWGDDCSCSLIMYITCSAIRDRTEEELQKDVAAFEKLAESTKKKKLAAKKAREEKAKKEKEAELKLLEELAQKHGKKVL